MKEFEPKILGFCCNWCAYAGADLAGISRIQYPPNIRMIRVMCSGTVDPLYILEALKKGADGVYVAGCLSGDCHFKNGNLKASRRIEHLKSLLDEIGVGGERVEMMMMSAGMGERFAQAATDFTQRIRELGPNPIKNTASRKAAGDTP